MSGYTPPSLIRVSSLSLSEREHSYVQRVMQSGHLTQGWVVQRLEAEFAALCGAGHAVACNSGTSALHLAYLALGLGPGDAIITSPLTYIATANAARYCGAEVLFADVREDDWTIDLTHATSRYHYSKADYRRVFTVAVSLYDALWLPRPQTIPPQIEDCAHAPGDRLSPNHPILSTHSFYASKVIGCGEGGMVVTNDAWLAARMRLYRGQGATTPGAYHHSVVGYNYRMTDLHAAIALAQLERLPELLSRRRAVIDRYRANLAGSLLTMQGGVRASGWMFACLLPEPLMYADDVAGKLREAQIETRPFFTPLHLLPMYGGEDAPILPVAEGVWSRGICLPTHADLTMEEVDYVCEKVIRMLEVIK